jgi:putative photosynthetic complex assembly protein
MATNLPTAPAAFPRGVLFAVACMLAFIVVAAGLARVTGLAGSQIDPATAVQSVELRFVDRSDGAVEVHEATSGRAVAVLAPGTNGFVRGVMRGMARERRQFEVGMEPPFRLTSWDNGGLSLEDPSTGRRIELEAFGPTNFEVFTRLLANAGQAS